MFGYLSHGLIPNVITYICLHIQEREEIVFKWFCNYSILSSTYQNYVMFVSEKVIVFNTCLKYCRIIQEKTEQMSNYGAATSVPGQIWRNACLD